MIGKTLCLPVTLLNQVDRLIDVDNVLDVLRPKQQDIKIGRVPLLRSDWVTLRAELTACIDPARALTVRLDRAWARSLSSRSQGLPRGTGF